MSDSLVPRKAGAVMRTVKVGCAAGLIGLGFGATEVVRAVTHGDPPPPPHHVPPALTGSARLVNMLDGNQDVIVVDVTNTSGKPADVLVTPQMRKQGGGYLTYVNGRLEPKSAGVMHDSDASVPPGSIELGVLQPGAHAEARLTIWNTQDYHGGRVQVSMNGAPIKPAYKFPGIEQTGL
jgi:hypothetical protein